MRLRKQRFRTRVIGVALGTLALTAAYAAGAEPTAEREQAPPVSVGARAVDEAPAPGRTPRTLPGTRAAEAHRLATLDPTRWLARFGSVTAHPTTTPH